MSERVLRAYYDTAGSQNDEHVIVTVGVVATVEKWETFDKRWLKVLADYGVQSFHMNQVAHWKGDLKSWNKDEERRKQLLNALIKVTKTNVNKIFVRGVELKGYREHNKNYCLDETLGGAYAYAQAGCITATLRWRDEKYPNAGLNLLVEHGDEGQEGFRRFIRQSFGMEPAFVPKRHEESGEDITPLSAADLIAYEHRLLYNRAVQLQAMPPRDLLRGSLKEIRRQLPIEPGILKIKDIEHFCEVLKIPRRENSAA